MNKKNKYKAVVALVIALAFVMPGAIAVANIGTTINDDTSTSNNNTEQNSKEAGTLGGPGGPAMLWNATFGGTSDDEGRSVQLTSDGGYIIVGSTESFGAGDSDGWLVKTDSSGTEEWNNTFGGDDWDFVRSVQQTSDGYIMVGYTKSFANGLYDLWLIKTDSSGVEEWNVTFGEDYREDRGYSVLQTSDGGYIVVGETCSSFGSGRYFWDAWLLKTDSSGTEEWNKTYGGVEYDSACSFQQTSDGGYIIGGTSDDLSAGYRDRDFWLIKTDSSGVEEWNNTFGGASDDRTTNDNCISVLQTSDGGYIMAGYTMSYGAGGNDAWLVKTDSSGAEEWNKTFGGSGDDMCRSVQQTSDGGYILTGTTGIDLWLIKTDSSGDEEWSNTLGGTSDDEGHSVQLTSDGGYIIVGRTQSYGAGSEDVWLIKVGSADHDVELTSIDSPVSGLAGVFTPEATVKNWGLNDETNVPVNMQIDKIIYSNPWTEVVYSGTGQWEQRDYATAGYSKPPGTGLYFAQACPMESTSDLFDTGLFTLPLDLTGPSNVTLEFEYMVYFDPPSGSDRAEVNTYSGGMDPANFEEELINYTTSIWPGLHQILYFDPSGYTNPSEVYIEFYYTTGLMGTYRWFSIDDVDITAAGLLEGFEGNFPPVDIAFSPEYNQIVTIGTINISESKAVTFPNWTPPTPGSTIDYQVTACTQMTTDENPVNDCKTETITLIYLDVITSLSYKWNLVSVPFSSSVDKADLWVEYDGTNHTWADAVSGGIVANALFGWNRISQGYEQPSGGILEPGYGYWLWAYHDCILKVNQ